jgi:hypothetical protein
MAALVGSPHTTKWLVTPRWTSVFNNQIFHRNHFGTPQNFLMIISVYWFSASNWVTLGVDRWRMASKGAFMQNPIMVAGSCYISRMASLVRDRSATVEFLWMEYWRTISETMTPLVIRVSVDCKHNSFIID